MVIVQTCSCGSDKAFSYRAINYDKPKPPKLTKGVGYSRKAQPVMSCAGCGKKTFVGKTEFVRHGK